MNHSVSVGRLAILAFCFVGAVGFLTQARQAEVTPARQPFSAFPLTIAAWAGRPAAAFDDRVMDALGVDEHVNRYYAQGGQIAHLYIGYYETQTQGSTIHSPMNCLPGAGWQPITAGRMTVTVAPGGQTPSAPRALTVNHVAIQKGLDTQVVLYWYQSHGRAVASEYWSKFFLVVDSVRLHRTDAALVRIVVPSTAAPGREDGGNEQATRTATDFLRAMYPVLDQFLPS
jgi:EpsI family protein